MLCTTTVSPSRTKDSSVSSSGRWVSFPDSVCQDEIYDPLQVMSINVNYYLILT